MNDVKPLKKPKCVFFDESTIKKCQNYAAAYGLSFAAVIRLAVNDFFLRKEANE